VSGQRGFSLLEAIVALALLASVGMALLGWLNSSLIGLRRVQEVAAAQAAVRGALAYLETINPMATPEGETELGEWRVRWQAREVEPAREGAGYPSGVGLFDVGLYDTRVWLERDGQAIEEFVLRQVGYRKAREQESL
jgi:general secretion pathway protein I